METDIVLADTSVVTANKDENADLLWGLRGAAGGNLGVNPWWITAGPTTATTCLA